VQADGVVADWGEWRLAGSGGLAAVEAVDVPQQVVGVLDAGEEVAALAGPFDGLLVVEVEGLGEFGQVVVDLGSFAVVEGGSADVVDRWERLHGSSPGVGRW
jgi:hypothetical protein